MEGTIREMELRGRPIADCMAGAFLLLPLSRRPQSGLQISASGVGRRFAFEFDGEAGEKHTEQRPRHHDDYHCEVMDRSRAGSEEAEFPSPPRRHRGREDVAETVFLISHDRESPQLPSVKSLPPPEAVTRPQDLSSKVDLSPEGKRLIVPLNEKTV
ncbi:unnamed protein product [Bursaphelenchus xylophilus]|uniref:(pine wood nematode) hypothetical protein n=1 Tax=Bursaphelenchus xylophilus TaxID=6326 RepID=A0A1I7SSV6_BURXY|nr:unnamed protein product [Bursaphelenchus xylophilus]CAG9108866.1 unnamed protein product [Bursaphelenchus xylophilus]